MGSPFSSSSPPVRLFSMKHRLARSSAWSYQARAEPMRLAGSVVMKFMPIVVSNMSHTSPRYTQPKHSNFHFRMRARASREALGQRRFSNADFRAAKTSAGANLY